VLKSGSFPVLINSLIEGDHVGPEFWQAFRARRSVTKWQRALLAAAAERKRSRMVIAAADVMLKLGADLPEEEMAFIRRARRGAANALKVAEAG
jgi:tagatose-1,6-bisphosphate aldolase non-catalytic subunit AgaZ/GatZ